MSVLVIRKWNNQFIKICNAQMETLLQKENSWPRLNFALKSCRCLQSSRLTSSPPLRSLNHAAQRSLSNLWALVPVSSPKPLGLQRALNKACFMLPGSVALRGNGHLNGTVWPDADYIWSSGLLVLYERKVHRSLKISGGWILQIEQTYSD